MHRIYLRLIAGLLALCASLVLLSKRRESIPAFGVFLHPVQGVWSHLRPVFEATGAKHRLGLKGLKDEVSVIVDNDQVKHIFAKNDDDLYFTQGYLHATDRLWEMEFLSRVAAGRLSEIFGERSLEYDEFFVKLKLPQAASASAELMLQDSLTAAALREYTKGVNQAIAMLDRRHLPFEFTLLGVTPSKWKAENTALLIKFMAWTLSGHSQDVALSRSFSRVLPSEFTNLFPLELRFREAMIPSGVRWPSQSRPPKRPADGFRPNLAALERAPEEGPFRLQMPHSANGSNAWVVAANHSKTGAPILANDIHLSYSLPSLWYEVQLHSPGQNVFGISLPGAPGVVLGFNSSVAWGATNGGSDVFDWYELRYRDSKKSEYLFDGSWRPVISRDATINVRGRSPKEILLRETHLGPILFSSQEKPSDPRYGVELAVRWAGLDPSNELKTFMLLNRAQSVSGCRAAVEHLRTPGQNIFCADKNDIAVWHAGRYPLKWQGQGRLILNGADSSHSWQGWLSNEEDPQITNPKSGFLYSANQSPVGSDYPFYLGASYELPYRAQRIGETLRQGKLSPEDLMNLQNDPLSISAREILPEFLRVLDTNGLSKNEQRAIELLASWDFRYTAESVAATIYNQWVETFLEMVWGRYFPDPSAYIYPSLLRTVELIKTQPNAKWFDDPTTTTVEAFRDVARLSFQQTFATLSRTDGFTITSWTWGRMRPTRFSHLSRIPGLGSEDIAASGAPHAVLSNRGKHGPVWRQVVALGAKPRAWSNLPGGQSGDPFSRYYDNALPEWRDGKMKEVNFMLSADDVNKNSLSQWRLEPKSPAGDKP